MLILIGLQFLDKDCAFYPKPPKTPHLIYIIQA